MSGANFDELKHKRYTLRREWTLSHVHIPKSKEIFALKPGTAKR